VGQWFRVELLLQAGTSATTGAIRAAIYASPNSTTPSEDGGLITGIDVAGTEGRFNSARIIFSSQSTIDSFAVKDGADAAWGPWPATGTLSPSVSGTSGYLLDLRSSSGTGALNYSLTWISGPNLSGSIIEVMDGAYLIPQSSSGSAVYRVTISDDGGTVNQNVTVPSIASNAPSITIETIVGGALV
jgi:hypothetical protein